ncbi:MAG: NAD(P)/FAD-dependent oxidoreductase [Alphaproteobacteria bacterium]|nr:NAD(P)/FAD-dependent oxidoreductase [Alphaproteobacteria bacterium]
MLSAKNISGYSDVCIIGAGVAGLYASYICRLLSIDFTLIEALDITGGQCAALYPEKTLYGVPGFHGEIAKKFIEKFSSQCVSKEKILYNHKVINISKIDDLFSIDIQDTLKCREIKISSKYIIVTTGIGEMKPNIPSTIKGIDSISSDFVQHCRLKQDLYSNKDVIVAGGGDSAVDFAINLSNTARSVTIIHRRNKFTCEPSKVGHIERLAKDGILKLVLDHNITNIADIPERLVTTTDKEGKEHQFKADHILFSYGFAACPSSMFGLQSIGLNVINHLIDVDIETMQTSIENCYAAGDVATYKNKKKNIIPCLFEADRAVRSIKKEIDQL